MPDITTSERAAIAKLEGALRAAERLMGQERYGRWEHEFLEAERLIREAREAVIALGSLEIDRSL